MRIFFKTSNFKFHSILICFYVSVFIIKCSNGQDFSTNKKTISVGIIFPRNDAYFFVSRMLITNSKQELKLKGLPKILNDKYVLRNVTTFFSKSDYPMTLLSTLCDQMIKENVVSIIYLANWETYDNSTACAQYFMHLVSYTGIPIIAWNADNSGLLVNRDLNKYRMLQLAPTLEHQVKAMVQILIRYDWLKFVAVTSSIAGNDYFVDVCRRMSSQTLTRLVGHFELNTDNDTALNEKLLELREAESRIFLLYSTYEEAKKIFDASTKLSLTGAKYMWIVTQSVVKNSQSKSQSSVVKNVMEKIPENFPAGMMAISFNTEGASDSESKNALVPAVKNALKVFKTGLNSFLSRHNYSINFESTSNCNSDYNYTWSMGEEFYKHLKQVVIPDGETGVPDYQSVPISFDENGFVKQTYLSILNLRPDRNWENIGEFANDVVTINDIAWPGGMLKPPQGIPEKYNLKIVTLDEPPFVILNEFDTLTNSCPPQHGVLCHWGSKDGSKPNETKFWFRNNTIKKCCSGFGVDLLKKLSEEMQFGYDLYRVPDNRWGAKVNGRWNGLVAELVENNADLCVTALKINSEREKDIDFSVPFLETGITILVAYRGGALSPTAFLEPFEFNTWVFILVVSILAAAIAIFLFEWLSPQSFDRKMKPPTGHKFSFFRSYWLVWATLFSASVNTDVPKSHTARFMALVWAAFSLTFLAVYTANLAAFMITRTEYYDLQGIDDPKIQLPKAVIPPFRYGTVISGNTEVTLRINYPHLHNYMKENKFFKQNVSEGINAVKNGDYHAFIYDAVVLQYLAGKDANCGIGHVGKWFSMTGYGIGLPKKSKWLKQINKYLLKFQENGELERLQNFWLTGACTPKIRDKKNHSSPLGIKNFVSAFALLAVGTVICVLIICLEYCYCTYCRKRMKNCNKSGWCGLISLSMGRSLTFKEAVERMHTDYKHEKNRISKFSSQREKLLESQLHKAYTELSRLKNEERLIQNTPHESPKHFLNYDVKFYQPVENSSTIKCSEVETVI